MNLKQYEGQPADPYKPGVYMLTGINGTGKSTVVDAIIEATPKTVPIHASQELRGLFGGISREELELLAPEEKLTRMVMHFTMIFERNLNDNKAVIMDTHLAVPVRKSGSVIYEDIWSDEYAPYVSSMAILSARPESIRRWRLEDERETGRKRNTELEAIALDQEVNIARFNQLRNEGELPASSNVVSNESERINETRKAVEQVFRQAS